MMTAMKDFGKRGGDIKGFQNFRFQLFDVEKIILKTLVYWDESLYFDVRIKKDIQKPNVSN